MDYFAGGKKMNNAEKDNKKQTHGPLNIFLCLMAFFLIIAVGLFAAGFGYDDFTGKNNRTPIFALHEDNRGIYRIDFLGTEWKVEAANILQIVNNAKQIIKTVFNEETVY